MRTVALGDLVDAVSSWNPSRKPDVAFTYIDLSAVDSASKAVKGPVAVLGAEAPSRARQIVATRDVLVSTVRPNLNAVAVVPAALDGATASTGFTVLRPGRHLDGRYLFHWVRCPSFIGDMVRKATGASYPAVSDRIVKESLIPLPPLPEQRRIAAILDHADALRAKRRENLAHLGALPQAIFHKMFAVTNWPTAQLSDVVRAGTIVTYGIVQAGPEFDGGVPYIRTGDIVNGQVMSASLRHTDPAIAARFERSSVRAGDIVMSIRATVGTTAVVPPDLDGANLTQGTARIAPSERALGGYLLEFLRSPAAQRWIERQIKGATFREITLTRLRELMVPLPPRTLQEEFAGLVVAVDRQRAAVHRALAADDELFASLQSGAFDGRL